MRRAWFSLDDEVGDPRRVRAPARRRASCARSRTRRAPARESDWLVGMNATRAATTRIGSPRTPLSLGRVQTPTLAMIVSRDLEISAFVPEDYWEVQAPVRRPAASERYMGMWQQGSSNRLKSAPSRPSASRALASGRRARRRVGRAQAARRAAAAALRPDDAAARGEPALRLHRQAHARRRPGAATSAQAADLPAHRARATSRPTWPPRCRA